MKYYDFRVLFESLIIKDPEMSKDRFASLVKDVWDVYWDNDLSDADEHNSFVGLV